MQLKKKLQVAQNKLVRTVMGLGPRDHVGKNQLQGLGWLTVEARVTQLRLTLVHRIVNGSPPNYLINYFPRVGDTHNYRTRASLADLQPVRCRIEMGKTSFAVIGAQQWNKLPLDIKLTTGKNNFKTKIKAWLTDSIPE